MIVLGVNLLLLPYLVPLPPVVTTVGIVLLVVGAVLLILGQTGHPVGGRRFWY